MSRPLPFPGRCPCSGGLGGGFNQGFQDLIIPVGELLLTLAGNRRTELLRPSSSPGESAIGLVGTGCVQQFSGIIN